MAHIFIKCNLLTWFLHKVNIGLKYVDKIAGLRPEIYQKMNSPIGIFEAFWPQI